MYSIRVHTYMCLYIHIGRKIITIKTKASACARLWISSTVRREGVVDGPWVCKARARLPNLSENIANVDYNNTICIYYICTLFPRRVNEIIYTAATASYIIYIYINRVISLFLFLHRPSLFYEFAVFIFWTLQDVDTIFVYVFFIILFIINLNIFFSLQK